MAADQSAAAQLPRPWYYQAWFLYPSFLFWPLWSVLIIRSPWQNNLLVGAVAWAVLFVGVGLSVFRLQSVFQQEQGATVAYSTLGVIAPGLLLTLITQVHWTTYRRGLRLSNLVTTQGGSSSLSAPARGARVRRRRRGRAHAGATARRRR